MLFGRDKRRIKRILIVEDEPLVAFDNEHFLVKEGYEIVGTVDNRADAVRLLGAEPIDLILADVNLSDGQTGPAVAAAAREAGIPLLFVTGHPPADADMLAVGCLLKPYNHRILLAAIAAVAAKLGGDARGKRVPGLTLFGS